MGEVTVEGFAALYEVFDVRDARGERRGIFETDKILTTNFPTAAQLRFAGEIAIDVVVASADITFGGPNGGSRLVLFGADNVRLGEDRR